LSDLRPSSLCFHLFSRTLLFFSRLRTEPRWSLLAVLVEHLHKFIVFDDEDDRVKREGKVIVSPLRIFVVTITVAVANAALTMGRGLKDVKEGRK